MRHKVIKVTGTGDTGAADAPSGLTEGYIELVTAALEGMGAEVDDVGNDDPIWRDPMAQDAVIVGASYGGQRLYVGVGSDTVRVLSPRLTECDADVDTILAAQLISATTGRARLSWREDGVYMSAVAPLSKGTCASAVRSMVRDAADVIAEWRDRPDQISGVPYRERRLLTTDTEGVAAVRDALTESLDARGIEWEPDGDAIVSRIGEFELETCVISADGGMALSTAVLRSSAYADVTLVEVTNDVNSSDTAMAACCVPTGDGGSPTYMLWCDVDIASASDVDDAADAVSAVASSARELERQMHVAVAASHARHAADVLGGMDGIAVSDVTEGETSATFTARFGDDGHEMACEVRDHCVMARIADTGFDLSYADASWIAQNVSMALIEPSEGGMDVVAGGYARGESLTPSMLAAAFDCFIAFDILKQIDGADDQEQAIGIAMDRLPLTNRLIEPGSDSFEGAQKLRDAIRYAVSEHDIVWTDRGMVRDGVGTIIPIAVGNLPVEISVFPMLADDQDAFGMVVTASCDIVAPADAVSEADAMRTCLSFWKGEPPVRARLVPRDGELRTFTIDAFAIANSSDDIDCVVQMIGDVWNAAEQLDGALHEASRRNS